MVRALIHMPTASLVLIVPDPVYSCHASFNHRSTIPSPIRNIVRSRFRPLPYDVRSVTVGDNFGDEGNCIVRPHIKGSQRA